MDPEQLNQYANQAGIIGNFTGGVPSVPPNAFGSFTDADVMANYVPGYTESEGGSTPSAPEGLITSPGQVTDTTPSEPAGPVTSTMEVPQGGPENPPMIPGVNVSKGSSMAYSHGGYSPQAAEKVRGGPAAQELTQTNARIDAESGARLEQMGALQGTVAQQERDAADRVINATVAHDEEMAHQNAFILDERNKYATKLADLDARIASRNAESRANYIAALNDYRASGVDPTQLWKNLSGGERAGMLATAFVHDFLGAKGIHTSAMDTWNKAIDRNINAQLEKIRIKGDVAQGFKQLWDMQRADSADEREAFIRMRGFALESLKLEVDQHMARFKSDLTRANGDVAKAKINAEALKNYFELVKHQDTVTNAQKTQAMQKYGDDLRASIEQMKISAAERAAAREAKTDPRNDPTAYMLYDPTGLGNGQAIARFKPEMIKKDGTLAEPAQKYLDKHASVSSMSDSINELKTLLREYGNRGITDIGRFSSHDQARIKSLRNDILAQRVKAISGAQATDAEVKRLETSIPDNGPGSVADIPGILAGFQKRAIRELNNDRLGVAFDFSAGDPRLQIRAPRGTIDPATAIDAGVEDQAAGKPTDKSMTDWAQIVLGTGKGKADRTGNAGTFTVKEKDSMGHTINQDYDLIKEVEKKTGVDPRWNWQEYQKDTTGGIYHDNIAEYEVVVSGLYDAAKKNDPKAIEELKVIRTLGEPNNADGNETRIKAGQMAAWALGKLNAGNTAAPPVPQADSSTAGTPELDILRQTGLIPTRTE